MRKKKQLQFLHLTSVSHQLPTWRNKSQKRARRDSLESGSESGPSTKRIKDPKRDEELLEAFQTEMKRYLSKAIQDCVDSQNSLDSLKEEYLNKKRLDR